MPTRYTGYCAPTPCKRRTILLPSASAPPNCIWQCWLTPPVATDAERQAGFQQLREAEELARRLGMTRLVIDISAVLHAKGGAVSFPDDLTAREVDVLRLLAIGRTNKDVSLVLAISLNTVATHVRSILNKTQCANRTEAATYAIRHGLHIGQSESTVT